MSAYYNFNQEISSRSAIDTGLTLVSDSYALAIINTGRDRNLYLLAACNISAAMAV